MKLNFNYKSRVYDDILAKMMGTIGAVLIEGPKWCGKTATGMNVANSVIFFQDPDRKEHYQTVMSVKPSLLLQGESPLLLDEWQTYPTIWDAVRFAVDQRGKTGQFILTGSAVPSDNVTEHTGTGRITKMLMRPMSLFESGESNGSVSLAALFDTPEEIDGISMLSIEDLAYLIARGGWPGCLSLSKNDALLVPYNYLEMVINQDVSRVDNIEKNPDRVRSLMRSLARNTATLANNKTVLNDIESNDIGISDRSLDRYLNSLRRIFVVEDMPAWMPSIRSKSAIRTANKRHFVDPSLAIASLQLTPKALLDDFETFGFLFESLCARDIRVYTQLLHGGVFHYRDRTGLESDMVIRLHDGRWAAVEVKLGGKLIEEAANNLLTLNRKVEEANLPAASFMMILTGGQLAYRRPDGIYVVPLGCLKP